MNSRKINLKIVFAVIVLLFAGKSYSAQFTKSSTKSFDVNPGALLHIQSEFSEIRALQWDKQKISVELTIVVEAANQSKANERFEEIKIQVDGNKDLVNIMSSVESGFFKSKNNIINIDILIHYPSNINLKIKSEFGSAHFESIEGTTFVDIEYGNFNVNELKNNSNQIEVSFGQFQAVNIQTANAKIEYGSCLIEQAQSLSLNTAFSGNVNIDKVGDLKLKSAYDKVHIGEIEKLSGSSQFSSLTIEKLIKTLVFKAAYGSFKLNDLSPDFELLDVSSEFCSLKTSVDPSANFSFYTDVELGSFNYPKEKVTITSLQKDMTDLLMEGYFGIKEKAKGKMRFSVDNASVTIQLK
ncbi:MAG TPA: hypothetical protein DCG69_03765 [Bacteroidales bacterium]|nr:hypothetical protein [Bacteroidales bacterium]